MINCFNMWTNVRLIASQHQIITFIGKIYCQPPLPGPVELQQGSVQLTNEQAPQSPFVNQQHPLGVDAKTARHWNSIRPGKNWGQKIKNMTELLIVCSCWNELTLKTFSCIHTRFLRFKKLGFDKSLKYWLSEGILALDLFSFAGFLIDIHRGWCHREHSIWSLTCRLGVWSG